MTFKSHSSNSSNSSTTTTASRVFPACKATALACTGLHAGPGPSSLACCLEAGTANFLPFPNRNNNNNSRTAPPPATKRVLYRNGPSRTARCPGWPTSQQRWPLAVRDARADGHNSSNSSSSTSGGEQRGHTARAPSEDVQSRMPIESGHNPLENWQRVEISSFFLTFDTPCGWHSAPPVLWVLYMFGSCY